MRKILPSFFNTNDFCSNSFKKRSIKPTNFLLLLLGFILLSTALADELDSDDLGKNTKPVYRVYDEVYLVSTIKFDYGKHKMVIKSVFPQLEKGNANQDTEYNTELDNETENSTVNAANVSNEEDIERMNPLDLFNRITRDIIQQEVLAFKNQVNKTQKFQNNLPSSRIKNDFYIDYDTSVIKSNKNHIISLRFSMQGYNAGMAHPYHYHRVLNYDLEEKQVIELSDLFLPDSNYLDVLSNYTRGVLSTRLTNKEMVNKGTEATAENFKNWNIKPNGLLITFEEYQVAPYVNGAQTVLVPYSVLKRVISNHSPIAWCVNHKRGCRSNNLLTGGFIDEAQNNVAKTLASA